jgi:hypothetical protein
LEHGLGTDGLEFVQEILDFHSGIGTCEDMIRNLN